MRVGMDLFVQEPIALELECASQLLSLADKKKVKLMVRYFPPHHRVALRLKEIVVPAKIRAAEHLKY